MIYIRYRRRNGGATEQGQTIKITKNEKPDHFQRMPEGVGMSLFVVTLCKYHQLRRYTHMDRGTCGHISTTKTLQSSG